jgi:hypothetical protein
MGLPQTKIMKKEPESEYSSDQSESEQDSCDVQEDMYFEVEPVHINVTLATILLRWLDEEYRRSLLIGAREDSDMRRDMIILGHQLRQLIAQSTVEFIARTPGTDHVRIRHTGIGHDNVKYDRSR